MDISNVRTINDKILMMAITGQLSHKKENDEIPIEIKDIDDKNNSIISVSSDGFFYDNLNEKLEKIETISIPKHWNFVHLSRLFNVQTGLNYKPEFLTTKSEKMIRILRAGNIELNKIIFKFDDLFISSNYVPEDICLFNGCFITPSVSSLEHIGKTAIFNESSECVPGGFIFLLKPRFNLDILSRYLYYYFQSSYFKKSCQNNVKKSGAAFYNLNKSKLINFLIPIPPFKEMKDIVLKLDRATSEIDSIESSLEKYSEYNNLLENKIIDYAITGKLVHQLNNEGTNVDLLNEIINNCQNKTEKKEYLKLMNLTIDEKSKYAKLKEVIPEEWAVLKGGMCFKKMESLKPTDEYFNYIDIQSVDNQKFIAVPKKIKTSDAPSRATRRLHEGDTIVSMVRPYLKNIVYIDKKLSGCIASTGFFVFTPNHFIDNEFLFYLLRSTYVVDGFTECMKGNNSPSINNDDIKNFWFPIPPILEQKRIVLKIKKLLNYVTKFKD